MVSLDAQIAPLRAELDEAIARVLDSHRFIGGPEVEALEEGVAELCGAPHAVACNSGTDALILSLQAAGVGPGDDVLCPAYSFFATAGAVARLGARPVFVDVDDATLCVGPAQAEAGLALCERPRAIVAVDLFGRVAPIAALCAWAEGNGLVLVEDAAQAVGARCEDGAPAASQGLAAAISFYPSKNLDAFGDGGIVTTREAAVAERLRALRNHGQGPDGLHHVVGTNSRLDAIQAAVLRVKLRYLDSWTKRRQEHADYYDRRFAVVGASRGVVAPGAPLATPARPPAPALHVYNQYVIRVPAERRDALRASLAEHGVETRIYYLRGIHQEPCFEGAPCAPLPATEAACRETLALPVHPELSHAEREHVADGVLAGLGL
jgi:dTDP-4-amino-4,6-dideoxygalactose transaminase